MSFLQYSVFTQLVLLTHRDFIYDWINTAENCAATRPHEFGPNSCLGT